MADVFGNERVGFGGAFKSTLASFTLSGGKGGTDSASLGQLLVSQLQANYNQPITRVYELASAKAFYVMGRPDGSGTFGSIFGPKSVTDAAYTELANPCNENVIKLGFDNAKVNCATGIKMGRTLEGVTLQSLGFQVNAQDMLINENVSFMFAAMTKT